MIFKKSQFAFTLAEVLITLGIIGIVAAMTIPSLINKFQKIQYVTELKKAYSQLQEVFTTYILDKNVDNLSQTDLFNSDGNADYTALDNLIKKFFKVTITCQPGDTSCVLTNITGTYLNSSDGINEFDSNNYNFCTIDGMCFSILLPVSRTDCINKYCGRIALDVNGAKPPNKYGRDYFTYFAISPTGRLNGLFIVSNILIFGDYSIADAACKNTIPKGGETCLIKIMNENWEMNY